MTAESVNYIYKLYTFDQHYSQNTTNSKMTWALDSAQRTSYRQSKRVVVHITQGHCNTNKSKVMNPLDAECNVPRNDGVCVSNLKSMKPLDTHLLRAQPDIKIFLPFRFYNYQVEELFVPNTYKRHLVAIGPDIVLSLVDGISYVAAPAPPLSQMNELPPDQFCNSDNRPPNCPADCSCTHMIDVPLNAIVEIVIVDEAQSVNLSHPFHLHGHTYRVIGMGRLSNVTINRMNLKYAMDLDRKGKLNRHFDNPPLKDTIAVPNNGYTVLRLYANNPGYWLFHCHFLYHIVNGMGFILHVGTQQDLPPVPPNFPRCGNFAAPITPPVMNPLDAICNVPRNDGVCVSNLKSAKPIDKSILQERPDVKIFLPFRFHFYKPKDLFKENSYKNYLVAPGGDHVLSLVDEISYSAPPAPPLSQMHELSPELFCNGDNRPANCAVDCRCTHMIDVPMNSIVEIVLVDEVQSPNLSHPFHLHGTSYNVIGMGRSPDKNIKKINLKHALDLDRKGLLHRQYNNPPLKDTLAVPNNGYVVLRLKADNPGYWLFHCHFIYHIVIGMNLILHVGTQHDLPPVPPNFPRCGNHLPAITPSLFPIH